MNIFKDYPIYYSMKTTEPKRKSIKVPYTNLLYPNEDYSILSGKNGIIDNHDKLKLNVDLFVRSFILDVI